jgi:hypothetical protein
MLKKDQIGPTLERAYERFLELPVPLVLVGLWLVGATLLGASGSALYLCASLLVQLWAGA